MGELIELPEDASWNATTGTFDRLGTKAAEVSPEQFAELIADRFGASELMPDQQAKAMTMLDNAVVYLHGVDPTNRLDRTPTVNSIAEEWATLGITMKQAEFMVGRTIEHTGRQTDMFASEHDRSKEEAELVAGGLNPLEHDDELER